MHTGVVLQFSVKKQRNKALFLENKAHFLKNKALSRIKVWVNFIFIIQKLTPKSILLYVI